MNNYYNELFHVRALSVQKYNLKKTYYVLFRYEKEGRVRRTVPAQKVWYHIIESQIETGTPYMLYKDACNRKSNQKNLGTIKCSNLCTEIIQYSSPDEVRTRTFRIILI